MMSSTGGGKGTTRDVHGRLHLKGESVTARRISGDRELAARLRVEAERLAREADLLEHHTKFTGPSEEIEVVPQGTRGGSRYTLVVGDSTGDVLVTWDGSLEGATPKIPGTGNLDGVRWPTNPDEPFAYLDGTSETVIRRAEQLQPALNQLRASSDYLDSWASARYNHLSNQLKNGEFTGNSPIPLRSAIGRVALFCETPSRRLGEDPGPLPSGFDPDEMEARYAQITSVELLESRCEERTAEAERVLAGVFDQVPGTAEPPSYRTVRERVALAVRYQQEASWLRNRARSFRDGTPAE